MGAGSWWKRTPTRVSAAGETTLVVADGFSIGLKEHSKGSDSGSDSMKSQGKCLLLLLFSLVAMFDRRLFS